MQYTRLHGNDGQRTYAVVLTTGEEVMGVCNDSSASSIFLPPSSLRFTGKRNNGLCCSSESAGSKTAPAIHLQRLTKKRLATRHTLAARRWIALS